MPTLKISIEITMKNFRDGCLKKDLYMDFSYIFLQSNLKNSSPMFSMNYLWELNEKIHQNSSLHFLKLKFSMLDWD